MGQGEYDVSEGQSIRSYDDFRKQSFFNVSSIDTRTSVSKVELPMLFNDTRVRRLNYFIDPKKGVMH